MAAEVAEHVADVIELHADPDSSSPESFEQRVIRFWEQFSESTDSGQRRNRDFLRETSDTIAVMLLGELDIPSDAMQVLKSCVSEVVQRIIRGTEIARLQNERDESRRPSKKTLAKRARAGKSIQVHSQAGPTPDITDPLVFLELIVTMDGMSKKWKFFTVRELQERMNRSERHSRIAGEVARSNEWAINECKKYGTNCLSEISRDSLTKDVPDKNDLVIRP